MVAEEPPRGGPSPGEWAAFGLTSVEEVGGGHQSRVFRACRGGGELAVKLTDGRLVDIEVFRRRVRLTSELTGINADVVGPVRSTSPPVQEIGPWLAVAYPWIEAVAPEPAQHADVTRMAEALARLHRSLRQLGPFDLPPVAALRVQPVGAAALSGRQQLLHGDFSALNVLLGEDNVAIFDFDDCGYGPVEFELGNTLFMELFDATMDDDIERYERFRGWFVDAYCAEAATSIDDGVLDHAIALRRSALRHWLDHPAQAPIGIRTSTPEWRRRLRSFADG